MRKVLGLDGVRAFAVLVVYLHHLGIIPFLTDGGHIGVDVFFVLSGFLIASILLKMDISSFRDFSIFYKRRALRLFPALVFFVLIIYLFVTFVNQPRWTINVFYETVPALFSYMNFVRVLNIYDAPYTGHTWSLAVEWQFYLIFPIFFICVLKIFAKRTICFLIFIIILQVVWRYYLGISNAASSRIYCGIDTHSDGLLLGGVLAMILYYEYTKTLKLLSSLFPISLIFFIWVLFFQNGAMFVNSSLGLLITNISAMSVIAYIASHQESFVVKILELRPLAFLGAISYGFYLWHYPVVKIMLYSGYNKFGSFFGSFDHPKYMILLCTFSASLSFALFSYLVIEKPFLKLKPRKR